MEFVLIRHSLTPGNLEKQYVGSTDQPLAPEGEALARERRERMPEVDGIWVSPLKRCRQTAELLFPGMEQRIVPDLQECDFGDYECKTWEELKDEEIYRAWIGGDMTITFPHGESMEHSCPLPQWHPDRGPGGQGSGDWSVQPSWPTEVLGWW